MLKLVFTFAALLSAAASGRALPTVARFASIEEGKEYELHDQGPGAACPIAMMELIQANRPYYFRVARTYFADTPEAYGPDYSYQDLLQDTAVHILRGGVSFFPAYYEPGAQLENNGLFRSFVRRQMRTVATRRKADMATQKRDWDRATELSAYEARDTGNHTREFLQARATDTEMDGRLQEYANAYQQNSRDIVPDPIWNQITRDLRGFSLARAHEFGVPGDLFWRDLGGVYETDRVIAELQEEAIRFYSRPSDQIDDSQAVGTILSAVVTRLLNKLCGEEVCVIRKNNDWVTPATWKAILENAVQQSGVLAQRYGVSLELFWKPLGGAYSIADFISVMEKESLRFAVGRYSSTYWQRAYMAILLSGLHKMFNKLCGFEDKEGVIVDVFEKIAYLEAEEVMSEKRVAKFLAPDIRAIFAQEPSVVQANRQHISRQAIHQRQIRMDDFYSRLGFNLGEYPFPVNDKMLSAEDFTTQQRLRVVRALEGAILLGLNFRFEDMTRDVLYRKFLRTMETRNELDALARVSVMSDRAVLDMAKKTLGYVNPVAPERPATRDNRVLGFFNLRGRQSAAPVTPLPPVAPRASKPNLYVPAAPTTPPPPPNLEVGQPNLYQAPARGPSNRYTPIPNGRFEPNPYVPTPAPNQGARTGGVLAKPVSTERRPGIFRLLGRP
ncbi:hypothetical protein K2X33_07080 [bacterium]|nr:hypothetical protein [bacterium]